MRKTISVATQTALFYMIIYGIFTALGYVMGKSDEIIITLLLYLCVSQTNKK